LVAIDGKNELATANIKGKLNVQLHNSEGSWRMIPNQGQYNPQPFIQDRRNLCEVYLQEPHAVAVDRKKAEDLNWTSVDLFRLSYQNQQGIYKTYFFDPRTVEHIATRTVNLSDRVNNLLINRGYHYVGDYRFVAKQEMIRLERGRSFRGMITLDEVKINPTGIEDLMTIEQYYGVNKRPKQYGSLEEYFMDRILGLPEDFQREILADMAADNSESPHTAVATPCGKVTRRLDHHECGIKTEGVRIKCGQGDNWETLYQWSPDLEKNCDLQLSGDVSDSGYYQVRSLDYDRFVGKDLEVAIRKVCKCD
ncbi:MAG: hypothetical protein AAF828_04400, partial [Bacteroidota bacterium]